MNRLINLFIKYYFCIVKNYIMDNLDLSKLDVYGYCNLILKFFGFLWMNGILCLNFCG